MTLKTVLLTALAATAVALPAMAQTTSADAAWTAPRKGDWLVTGRVTDVFSAADNATTTAAGADSGLNVDVGDCVMATLGFTYFLTDHWALEGILGTTKHDIRAQGGTTEVAVHETPVLAPVVTLQYRPLTRGRVSPYVVAGVNYMLLYGGDEQNGCKVHLKDGFATRPRSAPTGG